MEKKQFGDRLSELNLNSDETDRLTQAFRDEKFKKMLCDFAQEITEPANREKYEREIKLLEEERGNSVEFIHPEPCRVIGTRTAGGEQKCFINICGSEKIDKPDFKRAESKDGRRGKYWSLPYSLSPGRQNTDPKGNKYVIYDVIFHPDTLDMAAKEKNFIDMVNDTAIDGIQKTFKVILDKNNMREMKIKYKGTPEPCVIRKPIPDPLTSPYPDAAKSSESDSSFQIQSQATREPAEPSYTVKYRSVVDLQDYRCSRDSAPSPRPKEVVIVIDLPLLKSVGDTSLEVRGKILHLESKHPAYRLELPLAYPVDEDNGEAKFNKQRRQLTVTLPVQPPPEASFCLDPGRRVEESGQVEEEGGEERKRGMQGKGGGTEELGLEMQESAIEKVDKEKLSEYGEEQQRADEQEKNCKEPERKDNESEDQEKRDEETLEEISQERREELTKQTKQSREHEKTVGDSCDGSAAQRDCCFPDDNPVLKTNFSAEEETTADDNRFEASSKTEYQHILTSTKHLSVTEEDRESKEVSTSKSASKETTKRIQTDIRDDNVSEGGPESSQMFVTDVTDVSNSRDLSVDSLKEKKKVAGEGNLPAEQVLQTPEPDKMPPAALREIYADGKELSDHSTSAGFIFQNKLMYELD